MNFDTVEIRNISKKFGSQTILDNISLSFKSGEVCCILGENGAGKSSLVKILSGIYAQDSGEIYFEGKKITNYSPQKAQKTGVRMIHQECELIPELTVAQNIFLKNEIKYAFSPMLNQHRMDSEAKKILNKLQCNIDVKAFIKNLGAAQKQMVEIARALIFDAKVIIFDEPTSALLEPEIQNLFKIINKIKSIGITIIYISHKLEEIRQIADRVVIMRDGKIIDVNEQNKKLSAEYFVERMAGNDYLNRYPRVKASKGDVLFRVENLSNQKRTVKNVSFNIKAGEIVGLAGLLGAGKTSVAEMIYGIESKTSGKIYINENEVKIQKPHEAKKYGITYLSEYINNNVFINQNTSYNFTISSLNRFKKLCYVNSALLNKTSREKIAKLYLKIPFSKEPVKNLSQGTLQKLAIAKIIFSSSKLIIMDEPSKNLDIPSKVELYNIMNQLTNKGFGILLISSDTEELLGMCDRIYIMFNGSIAGELNPTIESTSSKILYYASGEHPADCTG